MQGSKFQRRRVKVAGAMFVVTAGVVGPAFGASTILGIPGSSVNGVTGTAGSTAGYAIDDAGDVAGYVNDTGATNASYDFLLYTAATGTASTVAGSGQGYAVSSTGAYAGGFAYIGGGVTANQTGVIDNKGTVSNTTGLGGGGTQIFGVNDSGTVVGNGRNTGATISNAYYQPLGGAAVDIAPNTASTTFAAAINNSGQITGYTKVTASNYTQAYVYSGGTLTPILTAPTSSAQYSYGKAINASGTVAGYGVIAGSTSVRAYTYAADGTTTFLSPTSFTAATATASLVGTTATAEQALGNDDAGDTVGISYNSSSNYTATLWTAGSTTGINLNAYLASVDPADAADWSLTYAYDINNNGLVTGYGYYNPAGSTGAFSGTQEAFVLNVSALVPEPGSLALITMGSIGLLRRRRSRA